MTDYLVNNYSIDKLQISKPKKHDEYLVSKVKYLGAELLIQFPKMKINSITGKNIQLEFISPETKYSKEVYNFLSTLDLYVMNHIFEKSNDWFGKSIPLENVTNMYNKFIKAPLTTDNNSTLNFTINKNILFVDRKNNELELSSLGNESIECISQLKYIMFSKDSSFTVWEMHSAKVHRKVEKVKSFGFIKDPVETDDSDNEIEIKEIINFF
uniref:Uncharacterized protein n=1 Tax=viral metagenome TaxID=1070528 RepID=A0A6C0I8N9_9ZZZZ